LLTCGDGGSAHSLCKTRGKNNSELQVMELEAVTSSQKKRKNTELISKREFKGQNVATPAKYVRKCVDQLILVTQKSS